MEKIKRSPFWLALLILGLLAGIAPPLQADTAHNVSNVILQPSVATGQYVPLTENLNITWTAPTTADLVLNHYIKFTSSNEALANPDPIVTTYDYVVDPLMRGLEIQTTDTFFVNNIKKWNTGDERYLHIVTEYFDGVNVLYSDYWLPTAIRIDNVAPTGGLTLNPTSGPSADVVVESMSFTEPIRYYWLSNANTFPGGAGVPYAPPLAQGGTVPLPSNAVTGQAYPIYAWFQDYAGNRSTTASASALYNYTASVAIRYTASAVGVGGSLVFDVGGAAYDWTITLSEAGVASIASGDTATTKLNATSITVNGLKVGTFTVTAVPKVGTGTLTSGVINVVQTTVSKTFTLATTAKTNVNAIGFVLENTGITTAHELGTAVGNCDLVSRWDEATQSYSSHPMSFSTANNFILEVGKAYFVSVTTGHDFTLTGSLPQSKTVTLVTTAKTNVNAVGMPKSKEALTTAHQLGLNIGNVDLVSRWDAATQSYSSHPMSFPTANNFAIEWGNGYFVSVTQNNTTWNW